MANTVLVGAQWGDEGKGKIIDFLTRDTELVVRYQGGNNAGHTVYLGEQKFVLHVVPSGILNPDKLCLIGNGVVISPPALLHEIDQLVTRGITVEGRLKIAGNAHCIMPYHTAVDGAREISLGEGKIGTTGKGIGPAYVDKVQRTGIRVHDLCMENPDGFGQKLRSNLDEYNHLLTSRYGQEPLEFEGIFATYLEYGKRLKPFLVNPVYFLQRSMRKGNNILFEGAQGTALDVDFGTYPFVTSSNPSAGGVCTGSGIGPTDISEVMGVTKAYATRVGSGPFPSEMDGELSESMRTAGSEFGATTGRPRRVGWLDAVQLRYACYVNGLRSLAVTKLDVLDHLDAIRIVTGYVKNGITTDEFPNDVSYFQEGFTTSSESWPGWQCDTTKARSLEELPPAARTYLARISELTGIPIKIISVGPRRDQTFKVV